jgi:hypothetical protein
MRPATRSLSSAAATGSYVGQLVPFSVMGCRAGQLSGDRLVGQMAAAISGRP